MEIDSKDVAGRRPQTAQSMKPIKLTPHPSTEAPHTEKLPVYIAKDTKETEDDKATRNTEYPFYISLGTQEGLDNSENVRLPRKPMPQPSIQHHRPEKKSQRQSQEQKVFSIVESRNEARHTGAKQLPFTVFDDDSIRSNNFLVPHLPLTPHFKSFFNPAAMKPDTKQTTTVTTESATVETYTLEDMMRKEEKKKMQQTRDFLQRAKDSGQKDWESASGATVEEALQQE